MVLFFTKMSSLLKKEMGVVIVQEEGVSVVMRELWDKKQTLIILIASGPSTLRPTEQTTDKIISCSAWATPD